VTRPRAYSRRTSFLQAPMAALLSHFFRFRFNVIQVSVSWGINTA
jgi:hypothetical protein